MKLPTLDYGNHQMLTVTVHTSILQDLVMYVDLRMYAYAPTCDNESRIR
jgi:hypothetical protein